MRQILLIIFISLPIGKAFADGPETERENLYCRLIISNADEFPVSIGCGGGASYRTRIFRDAIEVNRLNEDGSAIYDNDWQGRLVAPEKLPPDFQTFHRSLEGCVREANCDLYNVSREELQTAVQIVRDSTAMSATLKRVDGLGIETPSYIEVAVHRSSDWQLTAYLTGPNQAAPRRITKIDFALVKN